MGEPIIRVQDLRKNYGAVEALRGVSFEIGEGEVFGLLGPNGAGKTTTIEILEGLRAPDSGSVRVCGMEPRGSGEAYKHQIGGVLQATALPDKMLVAEAMDLFASFYPKRKSTEELLARFELKDKRNAFYSQLSGGQKQRVAIARALAGEPRILLADEPTAALDSTSGQTVMGMLSSLAKEQGRAVVVVTHDTRVLTYGDRIVHMADGAIGGGQ